MNSERSIADVERRALLTVSIAGGAAIVLPFAACLQTARASGPSQEAALSGVDVRKIAEQLHRMTISVDDAEKIAQSSASVLAPLGSLRLLKTAEVRAAFDFAALVADAARAGP
jgi:hypothetical protein